MIPEIMTKWCSFCSAAPAEGTLTIEDEFDGLIDLPCCARCVDGFAKNQTEKIEGWND